MELQAHKFADIFPMIEGDSFEELKKDIKEQGLQQTIITYEGKILDGRNRYKACKEIGIEPRFEEYKGNNPLQFVISLNLKRRHLNESQRAVVASKLANMNWGGDRSKSPIGDLTQEEAAKIMNVSERSIQRIKQIEREAPEKLKDIELGNKRADEVISEIKIEKRKEYIAEQRQAIANGTIESPKGTYEVIVIDPPWMYGNVDDYKPDFYMSRVANPYPEMTLEDIKNIKIPSSDNCVLWLWTTHKFIFDCRDILQSWGFRDVSILTWVKNKMGVGRWLRSQTEYCIMAIKGNPLINLTNQTTFLIADNLGHSVKPPEFYAMVNELCIGRKLDYFARDKKEGWDVYGIQIKENNKNTQVMRKNDKNYKGEKLNYFV